MQLSKMSIPYYYLSEIEESLLLFQIMNNLQIRKKLTIKIEFYDLSKNPEINY